MSSGNRKGCQELREDLGMVCRAGNKIQCWALRGNRKGVSKGGTIKLPVLGLVAEHLLLLLLGIMLAAANFNKVDLHPEDS
jgi:hypothetical protein